LRILDSEEKILDSECGEDPVDISLRILLDRRILETWRILDDGRILERLGILAD